MSRSIEEPGKVCFSCGKKYGTRHEGICTVHIAKCDVCGVKKEVTSGRNYRPFIKDWRKND